jgi:hypothetical protein
MMKTSVVYIDSVLLGGFPGIFLVSFCTRSHPQVLSHQIFPCAEVFNAAMVHDFTFVDDVCSVAYVQSKEGVLFGQ